MRNSGPRGRPPVQLITIWASALATRYPWNGPPPSGGVTIAAARRRPALDSYVSPGNLGAPEIADTTQNQHALAAAYYHTGGGFGLPVHCRGVIQRPRTEAPARDRRTPPPRCEVRTALAIMPAVDCL